MIKQFLFSNCSHTKNAVNQQDVQQSYIIVSAPPLHPRTSSRLREHWQVLIPWQSRKQHAGAREIKEHPYELLLSQSEFLSHCKNMALIKVLITCSILKNIEVFLLHRDASTCYLHLSNTASWTIQCNQNIDLSPNTKI